MDKRIFAESKAKIRRYVSERRLRDAFAMARSLAEGMMNGEMSREISLAEEGYRYMLDYAARGAADPGRDEMAHSLGLKICGIVDLLERDNLKADTPTYYYNTLRYEELHPSDTVAALLEKYAGMVAGESLFTAASANVTSDGMQQRRKEREALERRLFNRVWIAYPLGNDDAEAVRRSLLSESLPSYFKELLVGALMLGGLEYFDEKRVDLLLDAYCVENDKVSCSALIGVMLLLAAGREQGFSSRLKAKIAVCADRNGWKSDLRTVYLELAKTIDTDRITRKIRDEVVPEMLKLRSEIDKRFNAGIEGLDPTDIEENPEWHDMLDQTGISDKLKEMSEIQEEGGDVMMGTFAHLKSFPFFHEPANWFMPFHADYSDFADGDSSQSMQPVADMIAAAPFLCDSDKYSFMLSLQHVPAIQRDAMMAQLRAHSEQLSELQAASLTDGNDSRRNIINKKIHSIYRFYRLFRRKGEFKNPFSDGLNLVEVDVLRSDIIALDILPLVGEFYFSHGYYGQALGIFEIMSGNGNRHNAQLYQKMGYALQKTGDIAAAVGYYSKAEMLDGGSDWTLRRLARCFMAMHKPDEALKRLRILEERHPEHAATALNIGRCLVELGRYDEAIGEYYKAEYLDEKSGKALRPLAWCLLLTGDLAQSRKYYEKLMAATEPVATDYLNMGHLALAEGRFREALNFYSLNISARTGSGVPQQEAIDGFIADIHADSPSLSLAGVDVKLVPLLIDALLYSI